MDPSTQPRRLLLAAVERLLEHTPTSRAEASRILQQAGKELYDSEQIDTLDQVVWGTLFSNQVFDKYYWDADFPDQDSLTKLLMTLQHGSPEIHRLYLNHDFRRLFTSVEREWYDQLVNLVELLSSFPFEAASPALETCEQQARKIKELQLQIAIPPDPGRETLYHFILREVTTVLTTMNLHQSLREGWLVPEGAYACQSEEPFPAFDLLLKQAAWARCALRAIAAEDWLLITWQITPQHYFLLLH